MTSPEGLEAALDQVAYIDEYPHLAEKVRLRRLNSVRPLGHAAVFVMPLPINYRQLMEEAPNEETLPE